MPSVPYQGHAALKAVGYGETSQFQWYEGATGTTSHPVPGATGALLVSLPLIASTQFWVRVTTAESAIIDSPATSITVSADLELWGMGYNYYGELGIGTEDRVATPTPVTTSTSTAIRARYASGGFTTSHYVTSAGALWGMGLNNFGSLESVVTRLS